MADDPDRDILPVKDSAAYNVPRHKVISSLYEDVVQRQCVSKLPRSDLEDRCLRLCEENMQLKKQCNKQHEKIKRLATKLLRVVSDRNRSLPSPVEQQGLTSENVRGDQENRIHELETINTQLQELLLVTKNQLVSHSRLHSAAHCKCSRSPSRSPVRHPSRPTSSNAYIPEPHKPHENLQKGSPYRDKRKVHKVCCKPLDPGKQKIPHSHTLEEMELLRNQINMMEQDMEVIREESNKHIATLEKELTQDKRRQVTDNVEMIRLKRGLKQQSVQLAALQAQNLSTNRDVSAIQEALEHAHKENDGLHNQLLLQKQKYLDMQQEMYKVESSAESAKELKQALADLKQEKSTLKAHNDRLLELSASAQAIEVVRSQQMSERDSTFRSQLADVQSSLNGLLDQKEDLRQALEREKLTVSSLRQAHEELLSKFWDLQNQYRFLEQQVGNLKTEENVTPPYPSYHTKRIPSLQQSRNVFKPLLIGTEVVPHDEVSLERQRNNTARGLSQEVPAFPGFGNFPVLVDGHESEVSVPSDQINRGIEMIMENPSGEAKCGCTSASAASCTCRLTSESQDKPEPARARVVSELCEVELMTNSFTTASHSTDSESTNNSAISSLVMIQQDKSTNPMLCSSVSQQSACSNQPDNLSNKGTGVMNSNNLPFTNTNLSEQLEKSVLSEISQGGVSENRSVNLPPETQPLIAAKFSPVPSLLSNEPRSVSGSMHPNEQTNAFGPTSSQICNCGNRPIMMAGCMCPRSIQAQETCTNVPGNLLSLHYSSREVNEMAAVPTSDTFMATHLDSARELEKCREMLRVQYNLNALYKQELAKIREQLQYSGEEQSKRITKMCQVIECQTPTITMPQMERTNIELDSNLIKKRSLLRVGVGQGLFELHVGFIRLSNEGSDILGVGRSMFLTWKFYNQDVAYTLPKPGPEAQFDCSAVYRVQVDNDFLQYIEKEQCEINLNASLADKNELIAQGCLSFIELLDFPQNKLHSFVQLKRVVPNQSAVICGVLQCWYRLSCDVNLISRPKDDQHNEVQFDEILHIKTLTPLQGSPPQLNSEDDTSDVVLLQKEYKEEELVPKDNEEQEYLSEDDNSEVVPLLPEPAPPDDPCTQTEIPNEPLPEENGDIPYVLTQSYPSEKNSLTAIDSSFTSLSEGVKSDTIQPSNSKDLTLFQKRIQQLRKGLYSESSSPDLDDVSPSTLTEIHQTTNNSDDSIEISRIPSKRNKRDSSSSGEGLQVQSQKELEEQLTDEIRRSKEGILLANSETRDVLEIIDEKDWNHHVHSSNSDSLVEPVNPTDEDRPVSPSPTPEMSEKPSEHTPKEPSSSEVIIEIHWMTLDPESTPLKNPDVVQLYVEYTFLGLRGSDLETAMSLPTPTTSDQRLVFNYSRAFDVSSETHNGRRMELRKMLSRSNLEHSIHFMVISEPFAEESDVKDCEEIGRASVNIQTMLLEGRDYDPINIAILSVDGRQENIGNLNISIRGIKTLIEIEEA